MNTSTNSLSLDMSSSTRTMLDEHDQHTRSMLFNINSYTNIEPPSKTTGDHARISVQIPVRTDYKSVRYQM